MRYGPDPELLSGFQIVWMANELVGRYGVFVSPGIPSWWRTSSRLDPILIKARRHLLVYSRALRGWFRGSYK